MFVDAASGEDSCQIIQLPVSSKEYAKAIPYIITNEAAEFSFYGMKGILVIFMTKYMLDAAGNPII